MGHGSGHLRHGRAGAGARGQINPAEPVFLPMVRHAFAGIDIWPQIMARDAVKALGPQNMLRRKLLATMKPARHRWLGHAHVTCQLLLRFCILEAGQQGFISGHRFVHTFPYIRIRISVNGKVAC